MGVTKPSRTEKYNTVLIVGHGAQKLFAWFGGKGLKGTAEWLDTLDLNPPRFWALVAGLAEFLGGLGLALGLLTPIAAAAIIGVMLMAIAKVHWTNGVWASQNGFEYPLVNMLLLTLVALFGPGTKRLMIPVN